jgi:hypothetical protein
VYATVVAAARGVLCGALLLIFGCGSIRKRIIAVFMVAVRTGAGF